MAQHGPPRRILFARGVDHGQRTDGDHAEHGQTSKEIEPFEALGGGRHAASMSQSPSHAKDATAPDVEVTC
jgi:hypothetical protein